MQISRQTSVVAQPAAQIQPANSKPAPTVFSRLKILAPAIFFLAVILALNPHLFRTPYAEDGDFAANALQIQHAKAFRELLGNYSRWHFHHPGPAWFYLFAGGEYLFHDLLHLVPAAINAQILTIIIVNVAFLFGALAIFREFAEATSFVPMALAAVLLLVYVINRTTTDTMALHGALFSIWMPDVFLFCFLFFAAACASVAGGRVGRLPLMTFLGMLLIHGHVAQLLFVTILAAVAIGSMLRRSAQEGLRRFLRDRRRPLLASALIILIFLFPIVLEMVIDKPNNVQNVLHYMHTHHGQRNSLRVALKYCLSFPMGVGQAETAVHGSWRDLVSVMFRRPGVIAWWLINLAAMGLLALLWRRGKLVVPFFFRYILFEVGLVSLLFLYWAVRITGPLYSFNGFFFYSVQLMFLWLLLGLLTRNAGLRPLPRVNTLAACGLCGLMLLSPAAFRNTYFGNPLVAVIASRLPQRQIVRIDYEPRIWPLAVGVASVRMRNGDKFCVDPEWDFVFGQRYACHDLLSINRVEISTAPLPCSAPCRLLYKDAGVQVDFLPIAPHSLPLDITARDTSFDVKENFYLTEGQYRWSRRRSVIHFLLPDHLDPVAGYRFRFTGVVFPRRPLQIAVNGLPLGSIAQPGRQAEEFLAYPNALRPGENSIVLTVPDAGPVGSDPRILGYYLHDIQIGPALPPSPPGTRKH